MVVKNTDSGHELLGSKFLPARVLDDLAQEICQDSWKIAKVFTRSYRDGRGSKII